MDDAPCKQCAVAIAAGLWSKADAMERKYLEALGFAAKVSLFHPIVMLNPSTMLPL